MLGDDEKVEYVNILLKTVHNHIEYLFYASTETQAKVLYEFFNALMQKKS